MERGGWGLKGESLRARVIVAASSDIYTLQPTREGGVGEGERGERGGRRRVRRGIPSFQLR